ncbi:hypothetical protein BD779DRAFT_1673842 [Infundibulicybe gibba]|nr:hypothetical protein BD779DRAFT_1673842 [Infundibulicybe gibba]
MLDPTSSTLNSLFLKRLLNIIRRNAANQPSPAATASGASSGADVLGKLSDAVQLIVAVGQAAPPPAGPVMTAIGESATAVLHMIQAYTGNRAVETLIADIGSAIFFIQGSATELNTGVIPQFNKTVEEFQKSLRELQDFLQLRLQPEPWFKRFLPVKHSRKPAKIESYCKIFRILWREDLQESRVQIGMSYALVELQLTLPFIRYPAILLLSNLYPVSVTGTAASRSALPWRDHPQPPKRAPPL